MSNTTTPRTTLVSTNARIDALESATHRTNQLLEQLLAQYATPSVVVDATQRFVPTPAETAKATKGTRKSAPKPTAKAASKVEMLTVEAAQALVDAGADAWKITVASTNGNAVPFGLVLRARKASERNTTPKATKPAPKPTKAVNAVGTRTSVYFGMSKNDLVADGSKGAQAELARRAAKHTTK